MSWFRLAFNLIVPVILVGGLAFVFRLSRLVEDQSRQGVVLGVNISLNQAPEFDLDLIDPPVSLLPREVYYFLSHDRSRDQIIAGLASKIYEQDRLKFFPDPSFGLGGIISVQRATPVSLEDGGKARQVRTWVKTVGDLLVEQAVELGDKDKLEPDRQTELKPDDKVVITRVKETDLKLTRSISFKTIERQDPTLDKGLTRVKQPGQNGREGLYYRVRTENGQEVQRNLIRREIELEPVDKIILIGTKVVVLGQGKATWFSAPQSSAAHNSLPVGTKVKVVNLANSQAVIVTVIGAGIRGPAVIDLSPDAFAVLAPLITGVINVRLEKAS